MENVEKRDKDKSPKKDPEKDQTSLGSSRFG